MSPFFLIIRNNLITPSIPSILSNPSNLSTPNILITPSIPIIRFSDYFTALLPDA